MRLLITGGAGYIGSHVVRMANGQGHTGIVVDNLSTGLSNRSDWPVTNIDLYRDSAVAALTELLATEKIEAVIHLAARKQVAESVRMPEIYYRENIGGLANLLLAMRAAGVQRLVFSSSAACYGSPDVEKVTEETTCKPINPYGETKLIGEWLVKASENWGLRQLSLRYFNVAGTGWPDLADTAELNLIPILIGKLRRAEALEVFGDDYQTRDGSCERDYIHVSDLAHSHLLALDYLEREEPRKRIFNVGTGKGATVFEVISELGALSGTKISPLIQPRRPGDPARLVADVSLIQAELDFKAENDLRDIVQSAWSSAS